MAKSIYPWGDYPELNSGPKSSEHERRFSGSVKTSGKTRNNVLENAHNTANAQNITKK